MGALDGPIRRSLLIPSDRSILALVSNDLRTAILAMVQRSDANGMTMGRLVDLFVADGANEHDTEMTIWSLIQERRLTPHGFRCRTMRKANASGTATEQRSYEFVLIPWSVERDRQMDLGLDDSSPLETSE